MRGSWLKGALPLILFGVSGLAQAMGSWDWTLTSDDDGPRAPIPVSATPFDPTSLPQNLFFGRERYSSRAVAVELILNAAQVSPSDKLIYRPRLAGGYRVSTHWRFRLSDNRATLRFEIRF